MATIKTELEFKWSVDSYGDHRLAVDGRYFGTVFEKREYVLAVWDDGYKRVELTVESAKQFLERTARCQHAANAAFDEMWDKTG